MTTLSLGMKSWRLSSQFFYTAIILAMEDELKSKLKAVIIAQAWAKFRSFLCSLSLGEMCKMGQGISDLNSKC